MAFIKKKMRAISQKWRERARGRDASDTELHSTGCQGDPPAALEEAVSDIHPGLADNPNVSSAAVDKNAGNTSPNLAADPDSSLAPFERITGEIHLGLPGNPTVFSTTVDDIIDNTLVDSTDGPDISPAIVESVTGDTSADLSNNRGNSESGKAIRKYYDRFPFRCLIIGRANAGKTTILQRVCSTTEDPVVFSSNSSWFNRTGELERVSSISHIPIIVNNLISIYQLDDTIVDPTSEAGIYTISTTMILTFVQRGLHDVETQLVFKSNQQFIFHDSRGFEYGAVDEFQSVCDFIAKRAQEITQDQRLHVIW
jgi:hypothetical protein